MKVGDVVCLSSYGRSRGYNSRLLNEDPDQVGVVIDVRTKGLYPLKVLWSRTTQKRGHQAHSRRELKHASR